MYRTCVRTVWAVLSVTVLVLSAQGLAFASGPVRAPELDGSIVTPALGVLAAGVLMVRARRRSKYKRRPCRCAERLFEVFGRS